MDSKFLKKTSVILQKKNSNKSELVKNIIYSVIINIYIYIVLI